MDDIPADEEEVITRDDGRDRCYRLVRCASCGEVGRCTPSTDYYTGVRGFGHGDIVCEACMMKANAP